MGAQRLVHSRFNVDVWSHYLEHYQDRVIIDFLRYGWPINYQSDVLASSSFHSHPSAVKNSSYLSTYIAKELSYQSVFGPFHCNPFNADCVISPLLCVPKRDSVELSVVHDLSFHPLSKDLRTDINWWQYFLSQYNGVSVIPSDVIVSNPELFATDACLTGCGAVCFGECFHREFPDFILTQERHINELELLTVVVSIKLWAPKLQGLGVELLSDNATCVSVINSQHSPNVFMQRCL